MGIIYKLTSPSNKTYIGQTIQSFHRREQRHANDAKFYKLRGEKSGYCVALCNAINKYGMENFQTEILMECDDSMLDAYEREMIKKYDSLSPNGYNLTTGGTNSEFSEETRLKMSKSISNAITFSIDKYRKNPEAKGCKKHIQCINRRGVKVFRIENHPLCKLKEFGSTKIPIEILKQRAEEFLDELEKSGKPYQKKTLEKGIMKTKNGYRIGLKHEGEFYAKYFENTVVPDEEKLQLARDYVKSLQDNWAADAVQRLDVIRRIMEYPLLA